MCGIAGIAGSSQPQEKLAQAIRAMCDAIYHRGPDEHGYHVENGLAMGMRRLSVIDIEGGHQPMRNEAGSTTVVYNGEIYNHRTLRAELEREGIQFRTRCDTEVLVHLYDRFGLDMIGKLNGMFAFAIWDSKKQRLFIGRDRSGMKPLCYTQGPDGLMFFSEIRSMLAVTESTPRVMPASVMQFVAFGYVPGARTIFEGVERLLPGHYLTWTQASGPKVERYWHIPERRTPELARSDLVPALQEELDRAVLAHLESDVPLGAFLSGGLDSSTVVALMCRHAGERVRTFSVGFAEAEYDESAAARAVANALGTRHTELIVTPDAEQSLEAVVEMFDEPFGDSSAIPTFLVAQLARQHVTVALSGDGGDELFGGYTRYMEVLGYSPRMIRARQLIAALAMMLPHGFPGRNRLIDSGRSRWGRYAAQVANPVRVDEGGIAAADVEGGDVHISDQLVEMIGATQSDDFAGALMNLDFETYLPGDILTKVDRTSMAVSLEARVPLLDAKLIDFALALPGSFGVSARESKILFRRAIRGLVPDVVFSRPKQGFAIPLATWFRGPLRGRVEALRTLSPRIRDYFDPTAVNRLVSEHQIGRRDHSLALWRVIVLDCWLAALHDGRLNRPPATPPLRES